MAIVEVKIRNNRGPTPNQEFDPKSLSSYARYLAAYPPTGKWLIYLVPQRWQYLQQLKASLKILNKEIPSIKTPVVYWEEIAVLAASSAEISSNSLLREVSNMLKERFSTIKFSSTDKANLASNGLANYFGTILKLEYLVRQIGDRYGCAAPDPAEDEYGVYIKSGNKPILWVGLWLEAWSVYSAAPENEGKVPPKLWLGVAHQWRQGLLAAFLESVSADRLIELDDWTLTWIPDDALEQVERIFELIDAPLAKLRRRLPLDTRLMLRRLPHCGSFGTGVSGQTKLPPALSERPRLGIDEVTTAFRAGITSSVLNLPQSPLIIYSMVSVKSRKPLKISVCSAKKQKINRAMSDSCRGGAPRFPNLGWFAAASRRAC